MAGHLVLYDKHEYSLGSSAYSNPRKIDAFATAEDLDMAARDLVEAGAIESTATLMNEDMPGFSKLSDVEMCQCDGYSAES